MSIFKATFFCNYNQGGYSFSHWLGNGDYTANLIKANRLAKVFLPLLGGGVYMPYIRMSVEGLRGDSQIFAAGYVTINTLNASTVVNPNTIGQGISAIKTIMTSGPDFWNTSALLRLGASPTQFGHQFVRLIPDDLTILPVGISSDANWDNGLVAYIGQLIADQWGLFCIDRSAGYQKPILSFTAQAAAVGPPAVPAGVLIKTGVVHGLSAGQPFKISGFVGTANPSPNRIWTVDAAPDTVTIFVGAQQGMTVPTAITKPGQLWSQAKVFAPYVLTQCQLIRETARKAGRPFGALVGRRRKTKAR